MIINNLEINENDFYIKVNVSSYVDRIIVNNDKEHIKFLDWYILKEDINDFLEIEEFKEKYPNENYEEYLTRCFYQVDVYNKYTDKLLTSICLKDYKLIDRNYIY